MRQEYIETFLEIVNTRNISSAADNLFMSQSALSSRLNALEEELGVVLFKRSKGSRYVQLTRHGEQFIPIAERWMMLLNDTSALSSDYTQSIRVGSIDSVNALLLYPLYSRLVNSCLQLKIEIVTQPSRAIYDHMINRDYDFGLVAIKSHRTDVIVKPLFSMEMCVAMKCGDNINSFSSPYDLDPECEIHMDLGPEIKVWHDRYFASDAHQLSIDSFQLMEQCLLVPGRWALIPSNIYRTISARNKSIIKCSMGQHRLPVRTCYCVYHKNSDIWSTEEGCNLLTMMKDIIREDHTLSLL